MAIDKEAERLRKWSERLLAEAAGSVRMPSPVAVQPRSSNRKLAPQGVERARSGRRRNVPQPPYVSSTYVSIEATCPDTCMWKGAGCYADAGVGHIDARDRGGRRLSALEVTRSEVAAIDATYRRGVPQDGARGGRDLRLHVAGDVSCAQGAAELAGAAARWQARGGGTVWTYTHRWRQIPRAVWGPIAVLASIESFDDLWPALRAGYAPAIVVPHFESPRAFLVDDVRVIPCPAEAGERTCATCRLCLDPGLATRASAIAFALHGIGVEPHRQRLTVLQGAP